MGTAELQREQELEDLETVVNSREGRRVLARLVALSGVLAPSYASGDALATAYNEGLRRMGLLLLDELRAVAPEHMTQLLTQGERHE